MYDHHLSPELAVLAEEIQKQLMGDIIPASDALQIRTENLDLLNFNLHYSTPQRHELSLVKNLLSAINSTVGICIFDKYKNILDVNDMFCEVRGYTKTELIGTKLYFHSENFNESTPEYQKMMETLESGLAWRGQIENIGKNGSTYWVNVTILPVPNNVGQSIFVSLSYDMTQHVIEKMDIEEKYGASQEKLATIQKYAGVDWYWEQDRDHRFSMVSCTHLNPDLLLGKSRWEIAGWNDLDFVDWDAHKLALSQDKSFFYFEHPIRLPGHETLWVSVSGGPLYKDEAFIGYSGLCKDITERRRQEKKFWQLTHFDPRKRSTNPRLAY